MELFRKSEPECAARASAEEGRATRETPANRIAHLNRSFYDKPNKKTPAAHAPGANLTVGRTICPTYQSSRTTTRVLIGSFIAARRSASRAMSSFTPSISNITRPGFTLAAQ